MEALDLTNKRFGHLLVIKKHWKYRDTVRWLCVCDCGKEKILSGKVLIKGLKTHCGCMDTKLMHDKITGSVREKLSEKLKSIISRCYNPRNVAYKYYGGRGICVCEEWLNDYQSFYKWCLRNGWRQTLEIDRINNDGNYEPGNCRFVTRTENSNNKRNNVWVEINGEKITIAQASRKYQLPYDYVYYRWRTGKRGIDLIRGGVNAIFCK